MKNIDLSNKKFGKLTVLGLANESKNESRLWNCICDCGNTKKISTRHLNRKNNNIRSCGCLLKVKGEKNKQWRGYGEISGHWWATHVLRSHYKSGRKPIPITITIKEAWNLFLKQNRKCKLTGLDIAFNNLKISASLDRIDSSKGYEIGNIQWVHKDINFMKRIYSSEYFLEMCSKVYLYNLENKI